MVSAIGDYFSEKWDKPEYDKFWPYVPNQPSTTPIQINWGEISRAEFEALKKEVQEMKELLIRAKKYDEENNQPDCEIESKMDKLRKIAKLVGIDLDEVLQTKK